MPTAATREELADRIRDLRVRLGFSQQDLAFEIGVSVRTVQNWETGIAPQPKHRRALAQLAEVGPAWFAAEATT